MKKQKKRYYIRFVNDKKIVEIDTTDKKTMDKYAKQFAEKFFEKPEEKKKKIGFNKED